MKTSIWKPFDVIWFVCATLSCILLSLFMRDTPLAFVAALTGILYTLLAGKGLHICYFFGVINCICYALLSYQTRLYGEAMLYGLYYLPLMFVGFFAWKKKQNEQKVIVKERLTHRQRLIGAMACACAIAIYALLLLFLGGRTPGLDSATNVLSAAAMILTVKRCIEQWILWFLVNLISLLMWLSVYLFTGDASSIAFMYLIFLISGIIFYFQWRAELARTQTDAKH